MRVLLATTGRSLTLSPPYGLLTLAAIIQRLGVEVELFDLMARPDREQQFLRRCAALDLLWIGFSSFTPNLPAVVRLARRVRLVRRDAFLVLGGVHATALPRETLRTGPWDAVCVGEGEQAVEELTRRRRGRQTLDGAPNLLLASAPEAPVTAGCTADLGGLPLPAWELVDLGDYQSRPWQLVRRGKTTAPLMTSRGCPFDCSFCAVGTIAERHMRYRPIDMVLAEAELLVERHRVDELQILDDTFNANLERAKRLLSLLIRHLPGIHWKTPNGLRVDIWDEELVRLIKESGGYQVGFGLESGDAVILERNGKRQDLERARAAIRAYEAAGISTFGFFILGLPGETPDSLERTIRYASDSALSHAHAALAIPYPGTRLFDVAIGSPPDDIDWSRFRHTEIFATSGLDPATLRRGLRRFYLRFYARPQRAAGLLADSLRGGPVAFARTAAAYWRGTAKGRA